ncbi:MAG: hypothetical protein ACHQZS_09805 [Candidatus Binatales bacterium]
MVKCPKCSEEVPWNRSSCLLCGTFVSWPNVRAAEQDQPALQDRYDHALQDAVRRKVEGEVRLFESAVGASRAVINVDLRFLDTFLTSDKPLYSNYFNQVAAETRRAADYEDDRQRRIVEAALFGEYAHQIRYAALSIDGRGLVSYGVYSVGLRDLAIEDRASLLEENSFTFVEKHDAALRPKPPGYTANWRERGKLAVAKLTGRITSGTRPGDFGRLLLRSDGDRKKDEFIEVHIYGPLYNAAIETIAGPGASSFRKSDKLSRALVAKVAELLRRKGIQFREI